MGGPANDLRARASQLLGPRARRAPLAGRRPRLRWRGDALRVGEGTTPARAGSARELGLVTRDDWDELELRVAQLEHRLRLVEDARRPSNVP